MTSPVAGAAAPPSVITTPQPSSAGSSTSTRPDQLSSQAFLKLIVAQLQYQDPTQPTDTSAFMQQTATLNQIESTQQMTDSMNLLLRQSLTQQATALVGRTVSYLDDNGKSQTGVVTGARFDAAAPVLTVDGHDVALRSVVSVVKDATPTTP